MENHFLQAVQSFAALCGSVGVEVIVSRVLIMLGCSYTVRRGALGDCQHHRKNNKHCITTNKVEETPTLQFNFCPMIYLKSINLHIIGEGGSWSWF